MEENTKPVQPEDDSVEKIEESDISNQYNRFNKPPEENIVAETQAEVIEEEDESEERSED